MRSIGFTLPLNVLTLARHQPLYITLQFEQGPVFLINSRPATFAAGPAKAEPVLIPKLRTLFCRVPKQGFSRTPEDTLLVHLCWFAVRLILA